MPWTIWPALVILWGVCWMFNPNPGENLGDQGELASSDSTTGLIESNDLFHGIDLDFSDPNFDFNSIITNMSEPSMSWYDNPTCEQYSPLPGPALNFGTTAHKDFVPSPSTVSPRDTSNPIVTIDGSNGIVTGATLSASPAMAITQTPLESQQEATTSEDVVPPSTSLVHRQPDDDPARFSRSSKHGRTEKYLCHYPDCSHSQPGSGFKRKDHLDQHLRGPHNQTTVPRVRAQPARALTSGNSTASSDIAGTSVRSKKRKRESEGDANGSDLDKLKEELAEERTLRLLAEEENQSLRQRLEIYERRIERMRNGSTG